MLKTCIFDNLEDREIRVAIMNLGVEEVREKDKGKEKIETRREDTEI